MCSSAFILHCAFMLGLAIANSPNIYASFFGLLLTEWYVVSCHVMSFMSCTICIHSVKNLITFVHLSCRFPALFILSWLHHETYNTHSSSPKGSSKSGVCAHKHQPVYNKFLCYRKQNLMIPTQHVTHRDQQLLR